MIAIDLSKQQALDADPRAIQQINFTANLDREGNTTIFKLDNTTPYLVYIKKTVSKGLKYNIHL